MKSGISFGKRDGKHGGSSYCRLSIIFLVLLFVSIGVEGVFAAQVNESAGPGSTGGVGGYGWQQAYNGAGLSYARLTGSADRQYYDYGFKNIQVYARLENYWSSDCGWWYVSGGKALTVSLIDPDGTTNTTTPTTSLATKGRQYVTYDWASMTDPDSGRWNVTISDGGNNSILYYLYVRGQLNVSVSADASAINATITDQAGNLIAANHADNAGTLTPITVTAYVSGAGENFVVTLSDGNNDGVWTGTYSPSNPGDHKITVKATDGHTYWVDGRGSTVVSVTGTFPASVGLAALLQTFGAMGDADPSTLLAGLASLTGVAALRLRSGR